nr:MAG TPA: Transcription elongation factor S-II factor, TRANSCRIPTION [Caudoviricetes sp.]
MEIEKVYLVQYTRRMELSCTNNIKLDSDEIIFESEESARKFIMDLYNSGDLVWARLSNYMV